MHSAEANKKKFWQEHISSYAKSKLGIREYCQRESISHNTFYYWRRRISMVSKTKPPNRSSFVPVTIAAPPVQALPMLPSNFEDPSWLGRFAAELIRGLR